MICHRPNHFNASFLLHCPISMKNDNDDIFPGKKKNHKRTSRLIGAAPCWNRIRLIAFQRSAKSYFRAFVFLFRHSIPSGCVFARTTSIYPKKNPNWQKGSRPIHSSQTVRGSFRSIHIYFGSISLAFGLSFVCRRTMDFVAITRCGILILSRFSRAAKYSCNCINNSWLLLSRHNNVGTMHNRS